MKSFAVEMFSTNKMQVAKNTNGILGNVLFITEDERLLRLAQKYGLFLER